MASEWAIKEARKLALGDATEAIADALDAARAQGRREGLEEAAGIADSRRKLYLGSNHQIDKVAASICGMIASEIRARIAQEPKA